MVAIILPTIAVSKRVNVRVNLACGRSYKLTHDLYSIRIRNDDML